MLCFPRYDLPALALLFFPCLLMAVRELRSRGQAIRLGFLLSSMVAVGGFPWIVYVSQNFGDMPLPVALLLLAGFCIIAAPQMVLFLFAAWYVRFRVARLPLFLRPLFWCALYVALEYLAHFVKIFPENLGDTQAAFLSIAQVAAVGGVPLLTFLPIFLGAALLGLRTEGRHAWPPVAAALALVLAAQLWGSYERTRIAALPSDVLRVGFIQHNMDDAEKQFAKMNGADVVSTLVNKLVHESRALVESSQPKPDLLLWAETSYPIVFPTSPAAKSGGGRFAEGYANLVKATVSSLGVPLLFGGYTSDLQHDYNAGILVSADGTLGGRYLKQELLIFGEYMPFGDFFPALKTLNPMMGDFGRGPGPEPVPFSVRGTSFPLGVSICYEEILPEYMRGYVTRGARVFVNLTKDSWFGDTFEPWQHFQLSLPRAIENRVPLVRETNTGLSGVVDITGETRLLSDPFHEAYKVLEVNVPKERVPTLYTALGEWFALLCLAYAVGVLLWARKNG